jgi:hypothetical protein
MAAYLGKGRKCITATVTAIHATVVELTAGIEYVQIVTANFSHNNEYSLSLI